MRIFRGYALVLALSLTGCTSVVPDTGPDAVGTASSKAPLDFSHAPTAGHTLDNSPEFAPPNTWGPRPHPLRGGAPVAVGRNANRDAAPKLADGRVDCAQARCVALTFDDGPGPYTDTLLDMLKASGVPATFFVVGYKVAGGAVTVQRASAEGHAIGTHSWSHPVLTKLAEPAMRKEMASPIDALKDIGVPTSMIRPPYGARNGAVDAIADALGLAEVLWSVDTRDWATLNTPSVISEAVRSAHPGSIILMHDIHPTSVAAVPDIIAQLQAAGYVLVTVPELLGDHFGTGATIYSQHQVRAH
ncbi:polysaccharide deacetylase family protein [Trueperella pecoris]|uniref:polysaccharide deacetylase family protein n=1 Tax=Trueperella pecoris TaxID=2733571 RepID=UPI001ABDCE4E|nr:polysaccharide deacetylase family protein [Trueperella pecoris]QTG74976.1 polysaccharide deacetylase family protein [Trueperella pecoris]